MKNAIIILFFTFCCSSFFFLAAITVNENKDLVKSNFYRVLEEQYQWSQTHTNEDKDASCWYREGYLDACQMFFDNKKTDKDTIEPYEYGEEIIISEENEILNYVLKDYISCCKILDSTSPEVLGNFTYGFTGYCTALQNILKKFAKIDNSKKIERILGKS